jgi:hypothetical protein
MCQLHWTKECLVKHCWWNVISGCVCEYVSGSETYFKSAKKIVFISEGRHHSASGDWDRTTRQRRGELAVFLRQPSTPSLRHWCTWFSSFRLRPKLTPLTPLILRPLNWIIPLIFLVLQISVDRLWEYLTSIT